MQETRLNIISFDVPYPPDYGGAIDVFYKIVALHKLGVKIHLHCFKYGREEAAELDKYCISVSYYDRNLRILDFFSKVPFVVKTRKNKQLLSNLNENNYPILFEGLHTTAFLNAKTLKNRTKIVRTHNVEHDYYSALAKYEKNIFKRLYFSTEALKLKKYERVLSKAQSIFSISEKDNEYFLTNYKNTLKIPAFHNNFELKNELGTGDYILFHGNLQVKENEEALFFLIENVFRKISYQVRIAGRNPSPELINLIKKFKNIELFANLSHEKMSDLVANAQIIVLYTFQATGIKLKLLNSLYEGRFCIANDKMLFGTDLDKICIVANSAQEIINNIKEFFYKEFSVEIKNTRKQILEEKYSNQENALTIFNML